MITVGIDEVGRGCWAGPLVAGAVILPREPDLRIVSVKLRDSKRLSKRQRAIAAAWLEGHATVGLGWVWPAEIDELGLSAAVRMAMERALAGITVDYDEIIIDGNVNYLATDPKARAIIKADDTVPSVSAASIVAKVARDTYMVEAAQKYPGYGFEGHVGYGTAKHIAALKTLGASDIHRRSYKPIKQFIVASF